AVRSLLDQLLPWLRPSYHDRRLQPDRRSPPRDVEPEAAKM
ncbi:MAG: hypothetical protein AVDCRST_MAG90-700, partial [uncultured Microvirga sp.]